jgi:hypothetical protein
MLITNVNCVNPIDLFPSDHYLIESGIKLCFKKAKAVRQKVYDFNGAGEHFLHVPFQLHQI